PGNDHYHALDQELLAAQVARLERAVLLAGGFELGQLEAEQLSRRHARRSLVAAQAIAAGTVITAEHLVAKRPAHGVSPARIHEVVGRRAGRDIPADAALQWDDLA